MYTIITPRDIPTTVQAQPLPKDGRITKDSGEKLREGCYCYWKKFFDLYGGVKHASKMCGDTGDPCIMFTLSAGHRRKSSGYLRTVGITI